MEMPLSSRNHWRNWAANVWGEDEASRSLYLCFPGTVRVDVVSTHRVEYPKPGKPVFHPASIQEDLRRRDFTVNSMAISLNEGSYGLLMDPLNGAADIEAARLAPGFELRVHRRACAPDSGHALPRPAGLGDGSENPGPLRQRQDRGRHRVSFPTTRAARSWSRSATKKTASRFCARSKRKAG